MLNFIKPTFHHLKIWKSYGLLIKVTSLLLLTTSFFVASTFGQAGDLSQIRNGSGKVQNQVLDTCGTCWVNGNAGASNAHYVEGMSIAYRSLITGLTANTCYEYELGYDTYHGAVAIDYLTHFQRLEPHQPFGHIAEVIDPTFFVSGSSQYHMHLVDAGPNTISIDPPAAGGVSSGTFNADGTARNDANQPLTSFNALPASEKKFTIYNGTIENFEYLAQPQIVVGGADVETRIRIRFLAHSDSVVLAWGGHIASRLDWGYTKDSKGKLSPLSAGGISGSPYHMRQKAFDRVDCGFDTAHVLQSFSGFGNQDRSLSAAAVVPPPTCPNVASDTICIGGTFDVFTITNPVPGTTYKWYFGSNTAGAKFSTNTDTVTGTSATVVPIGTNFTAGTFSLNIKATLNSIDLTCTGVATGKVNPNPTADAGTAPAAQCAVAGGNTFTLNGSGTNGTCSWAVQSTTGTAAGSFNSGQTSCTASVKVTGTGTVTFRLTVTSNQTPSCGTQTSDVTVTVNAQPGKPSVTYNAPACDASTFSVTVNSPIAGATYTIKDKCGNSITGVKANGVTGESFTPSTSTAFDFSNIPAGSGFKVIVSTTAGCKDTTTCGTCSTITKAAVPKTETAPESPTTVKAYPNPFSDKINFVVTTPISGKGSLEVYNMMGQKVRTVYQGFISAGTQTFQMNSQRQQVANLVYVLRIGDKKITGRILQINQ